MSRTARAVVVGAGMGGLAAAIDLAGAGWAVEVVEKEAVPGGKMRVERIGGAGIDAGPTVLTLRGVFDELFADAGLALDAAVTLRPLEILARHSWGEGECLDLFADPERSADAIGTFAGAAEARGFRRFAERARLVFEALDRSFMRAARPTPFSLVRSAGMSGLGRLWDVAPFTTLWKVLGEFFQDARLRQLFARYATYSGSSPFLAPATLMLIAHAEQRGVWMIEGGIHRLADAMAALAARQGTRFRYGVEARAVRVADGRAAGVRLASGEEILADAVVMNADCAALAAGRFGAAAARAVRQPGGEPSLSAVTFAMLAEARGFPLVRHTVFFSRDYAAEFADILRDGRLPANPTVYVCAQDRADAGEGPGGPERLFLIVNAPPLGGVRPFTTAEIERCEANMTALLARCGLVLRVPAEAKRVTTPADFAARFPDTRGALYGPALHDPMAPFRRPTARTKLPGLYLAGGSVHPGPGVPMAALSGRMAASCLVADHAST